MKSNYFLKSIVLVVVFITAFSSITYAQLTGVKTVGSGKTYTTLAAAISALNTSGVGAGGVIFDIDPGFTETAPGSGFTINTATGSSTNTIVFRKAAGAGANPLITASGANSAGNAFDAIIRVVGTDYVTFDAIDLRENPANSLGAAGTYTEFGYAFFANSNNGANNCTVKNCTITMNNFASGSEGEIGIYSNTAHVFNANSTPITTSAGCNNNHVYTNNTIYNCAFGIAHLGLGTIYDDNTDVGGNSYALGNKIYVFGRTAMRSGYSGLPGTSQCGVLVAHSTNTNISYNIVSGNSAVNNNGIYLRNSGTAPATTHASNIKYNQVNDTCTSSSSSYQLIGILNDMGGTNHTVNITDNKLVNFSTSSATFQGGVIGIQSSGAMLNLNINTDTFAYAVVAGSAMATSTAARSAGIKVTNVPTGTISVSNNLVKNLRFNNSGAGDFVALDVNGAYSATATLNNNYIDSIVAAGTGSIYGYGNTGSPSGALTVSNNNFRRIFITGGGSSSWIRFVHSTTGASQTINVNGNTIYDLGINSAITSSGVTGINITLSNTQNLYNNSIRRIFSGSTNIGIYSSSASTVCNIYGNTIDSLFGTNATSAPTHEGIENSTSGNIYSNKISNIDAGASTNGNVYGIRNTSGTTANIYNNMVSDLRAGSTTLATGSVIRGITATATNVNAFNNTVYLSGSSSGTDFSTACFAFSGTTTADCRNNIFVNNCTPKGTGFSAAIQRLGVGTQGTVPVTFSTNSNNNCLYAKSVTNGVLFVEGQYTGSYVNAIQANCFDVSAYQTFMSGGRETNCFSEIPPFLSTSTPMDMHLNTATASACWNGGTSGVSGTVTNDIDATSRPQGSAYDVGADEGLAGSPGADKTPPSISYTALGNIGCAGTTTITATITDANGIATSPNQPRLYYKKTVSFDSNNNIATANNSSASGWKYVTATGSGPYTFTFNYALLPGGFVSGDSLMYFVTAQDPSGNVGANNANITPCPTTVQFTSTQTATAPPTINFFVFKPTLSGNYDIGGSTPDYPNLTGSTGLFNAINSGLVSGNITATIKANITEPGTVTLNQWSEFNTGTCTAIVTPGFTLTVQSDGTQRILSNGSNLTTPLINHNGPDRVTYTGGTGTQRLLLFRHTNTATTSCYPVFQFDNGCNRIKINNCIIETNGTSAAAPVSAGIYWANAVPVSNNAVADLDTFTNNDFTAATGGTTGVNRFGLYCDANANNRLVITQNNFVDFCSSGVYVGNAAANGWTISKNSFYQSGTYTSGASFGTVRALYFTAGSSTGHAIDSNYIGGRAPLAAQVSGVGFVNSSITGFLGMSIFCGTAAATNIRGNVIKNIYISSNNATFTGLELNGNIYCYGNTIGDPLLPSILVGLNTGITIHGNNYGIVTGATAAAPCTVRKNLVGNIWYYLTNTTSISRLHGINISHPASSTIIVDSNVVVRLVSTAGFNGNMASTSTSNAVACVAGIITTSSASAQEFKDNAVNFLRVGLASQTTQPGIVAYALDANGGTSSFFRNVVCDVQNLAVGTASASSSMAGIRIIAGAWQVYNNVVSLINGSNTNQCRMMGIVDNSSTLANIYHNTIHISGTNGGTAALGRSSAYCAITSSGSHLIRDNIFSNVRSGGTGKHYSMAFETLPSLTSNYNDIFATTAATQVLNSGADVTIGTWKLTQDANSKNVLPIYVDAPNCDLHLDSNTNCALDNKGLNMGLATDYDGDTRNAGTPDIGADEFNLNPRTRATIVSTPICLGQPLSVTVATNAPATLSYTWSVPAGLTNPGNTSSYSIGASTASNAGHYKVTVTDVYSCTSTFDSTVVVNANPTASPGFTYNPGCIGTTNTLSANATAGSGSITNYEWSGGIAGNNASGTIATAGSYTVTVTNSNGCTVEATSAALVISPRPTSDWDGPASLCLGVVDTFFINFTGTAPYTFTYTDGITTSAPITTSSNPYALVYTASSTAARNFQVTALSDANCTAQAGDRGGVYSVNVTTNCVVTWTGNVSTSWHNPANWDPNVEPNSCNFDIYIPKVTNQPTISTKNIQVGNVSLGVNVLVTVGATRKLSVCKNWIQMGGGGTQVSGGDVVMNGSVGQTISGGNPYVSSAATFDKLIINNSSAGVTNTGHIRLNTGLILQDGDFTNNNIVTLKSSATGTAYLDNFTYPSTAGTYVGAITSERYNSGTGNGGYSASDFHYIASGVTTTFADWNNIHGNVVSNGTGAIKPLPTCDPNNIDWTSPYGALMEWHENGPFPTNCSQEGWYVLGQTAPFLNATITKGRGYSAYLKPGQTVSVTGNPNTGNIPVTLTNSGLTPNNPTGPVATSGQNLIGNPYPSPYQWDRLGNSSNIGAIAYAWQATSGYAGTYQNITVGSNIAVAQGFMVLASSGGAYNFQQNKRQAVLNPTFYKNQNGASLIVEVSGNNFRDKTEVAFNDQSTTNFDFDYDGYKMMSKPAQPTLYTGLSTNKMLSLNTQPSIAQAPTVPMGMYVGTNGNFTFTFDNIASFDPTTYIYLEDKQTATMQDMRANNSYSFVGNIADATDRFVIHFTPPMDVTTTDASCTTTGTIKLEQPGTASWTYTLKDNGNNTISTGTINSNTPASIAASNGIYTLELVDAAGYNVSQSIQVNGVASIAAAFNSSASSVRTNEAINFNNTTSGASTYSWDFGDGSNAITTATAAHSYAAAGTYTVTLTVTNAAGCQSSVTRSVTVSNATGITEATASSMNIFSFDDKVVVDFSKMKNVEATIQIYNLIGQELSSEKHVGSSVYTKELNEIDAAYVLVRVRSSNGQLVTKKVFISNSK